MSANPGDVLLTVSGNPESGFPLTAGTTVPAEQIQIQGKSGPQGSLTVAVNVGFDSPLTVTTGTNNALDLEFDLSHPAFIVGHTPPAAAGATLWAVDFKGPVRHHPVRDIAALVLRHLYGSVGSVAADGASLTVTRDFPVLPVTNPETAVAGAQSLQIQADAVNGTIFYDVDAKTRSVVTNFSAQAMTLPGKFVRIAARYQEDGSLVAVRVWASSEFSKVWLSPEGHVAHVNTATDVITVDDESGIGVPVSIDANTQFFFRAPADPSADATPIGTGTGFLTSGQLVRGFKVHVSAVDPLATPLVAQSIDIETAAYSGRISAAGSSGFTYTRSFARSTDDYTVSLDYIAATTPNGTDGSGNPVTGFKWWDLTFPTLVTTGSAAIADFVSATAGGVNFGGTVGALQAWGVSRATWGDPADPSSWTLRNAVLVPTPLPLGTVTTPFAAGTFAMSVAGGTLPATVAVEHERAVGDPGVPARPLGRGPHHQPDRRHDRAGAAGAQRRPGRRGAGQGLWRTAARRHAQGLRARVLHRHDAGELNRESNGEREAPRFEKRGAAEDPRRPSLAARRECGACLAIMRACPKLTLLNCRASRGARCSPTDSSRTSRRRQCGSWPASVPRRPRRRTCATCARCRGARSTTMIRATSTSCRWRSPRPTARCRS